MIAWLRRIVLSLLVLVIAAALLAVYLVRASRPVLEGEVVVAGLAGRVEVRRDAQGVPAIEAGELIDAVRTLGFLHGQERFFTMDLTRRMAAGELAALIGPAGLDLDRRQRIHRFRAVARRAVERAEPEVRRFLDAYAEGVNAGLEALGARPFEYLLLRQRPAPWRAEDVVLTVLAMFIDLQDERGEVEANRSLMHEVLPGALAEFLDPEGTDWDAPLMGAPRPAVAIPGPEVVDLRGRAGMDPAAPAPGGVDGGVGEPLPLGSNNWAVSGRLTADGRAIVANDMHLLLRVPNIWYRAVLRWKEGGEDRRAVGVTLPGTPGLVAGSNGFVAWGFTNSYGDWSDLVVLEVDPAAPDRYRTPQGWKTVEVFDERIEVAGGAPEHLEVRWTIWGPIVDRDRRGRPRAFAWVPHRPGGVNVDVLGLFWARTVDEAIEAAHRAGIPQQNAVIADREGRIGWTIMGRLPRRVGFRGQRPRSWADGSVGWFGWLPSAEVPRIVDPPSGRLWTANSRVAAGEALRKIGDGAYAFGARAHQIRRRLFAAERFDERGLLQIQLDDEAIFMSHWHRVLLALLDEDGVAGHPGRAAYRRHLVGWGGHAAVDSVGYRLVRGFHDRFDKVVVEALTAPCRGAAPEFSSWWMRQREGALLALARKTPEHLVPPGWTSWRSLMLDLVDRQVDALGGAEALSGATWGARNTSAIRHPLSRALPFLSRWLDMPARPLPGDIHMIRFQSPVAGASERFVVSPGHEDEGVFHMPGGQSGHPLSPFYGAGHRDWEQGRPTPLLPGSTRWRLVLRPE